MIAEYCTSKSRRDNTLLTVGAAQHNLRIEDNYSSLSPAGTTFSALYSVASARLRECDVLPFRRLKSTVNKVLSLRDFECDPF